MPRPADIVSPIKDQPTVSLSGSDSAVDIAHELRKVHAADPIAPLYKSALGPPPPIVHQLVEHGRFEENWAAKTARAVFDAYAVVQTRFYKRQSTGSRATR